MSKNPESSPNPFAVTDLPALVLATPDEMAIVTALNWLDWWLGKGPKGLDTILAVLKGVEQPYNSKGRKLQHMSETQAKRVLASLKARGWLKTGREEMGGLAVYTLTIPRMELDDAKDLVASRMSAAAVAKLGGNIKFRVARMAGKAPIYKAQPAPAGDPEQQDLLPEVFQDETLAREVAIQEAADAMETIWSDRWGKKYREIVLEAKGATRGVFEGFAREGVSVELFDAKVEAYLLQADDEILKKRHTIFWLRIRWAQLGAVGTITKKSAAALLAEELGLGVDDGNDS